MSKFGPVSICSGAFTFHELRDMVGGKLGSHDLPCPECGPFRSDPRNRIRKVMRVWLVDDRFATWHCERCGGNGHAIRPLNDEERAEFRKSGRRTVDSEAIRRARAEAQAREVEAAVERLQLAKWLWRQRIPIPGTVVEVYLREIRGYGGQIPATLGYLPGRNEHPRAMIAAYGVPIEPEPGVLRMTESAFKGVQITRLSDRGEKIPDDSKKTIGKCAGQPIVVAPLNDLLGLAIAEGAEDALSIAEATGLGAWAAGGASRLPALADAVPSYADCVNVVVDDDLAGKKHSAELVRRLTARRLNAEVISLTADSRAA